MIRRIAMFAILCLGLVCALGITLATAGETMSTAASVAPATEITVTEIAMQEGTLMCPSDVDLTCPGYCSGNQCVFEWWLIFGPNCCGSLPTYVGGDNQVGHQVCCETSLWEEKVAGVPRTTHPFYSFLVTNDAAQAVPGLNSGDILRPERCTWNSPAKLQGLGSESTSFIVRRFSSEGEKSFRVKGPAAAFLKLVEENGSLVAGGVLDGETSAPRFIRQEDIREQWRQRMIQEGAPLRAEQQH